MFARGERQVAVFEREHAGVAVVAQVGTGEGGIAVVGIAAQEHANTGFEFGHIEGFGDVVIRTRIEAGHARSHDVLRGQHQHRHIAVARAQALQDFFAFHARQPEVEDDQVIALVAQPVRGVLAFVTTFDHVAVFAQGAALPIGQHQVVLDQQYAHGISDGNGERR